MHSALYFGRLSHRRLLPRRHAFRYRLCMVWLDLAELEEVFRGRWFWSTTRPSLIWLKRSDFLGDAAVPLDQAVRDLVESETGARPTGPVRLLTRLRSFGHCFTPVSFYSCYDAAGDQVEAIVAEVTNTPWNERYAYVLPARESEPRGAQLRFSLGKRLHVSPFMPMDIDYDWQFNRPGDRLAVHMANRRGRELLFEASLALTRHEITAASLATALVCYQLARWLVLGAIHWQALRLWAKRIPFHTHPAKPTAEKSA
jgi:uncharacterized protein